MTNLNGKLRAGIYLRVSTLEQAKEGYSLVAQEEKLKNYASYKGYEVLDSPYRDDGYSGATINRPGFRRLMADVEANKLDIVLIYKLDRLSRNVKDLLNMLEVFDKHNVTLFSLNENIDLSSPFGRAALKMSATFSELERETIIERSKMGKEQKLRAGEFMSSKSPFGYTYDKLTGKFNIKQEEAEIVRDIFQKYVSGYSIRALNEYCHAKYENPYFGNAMSCKSILHRTMYTGYFVYKGDLIKGTNFESIIPYELFLKAQKQLETNSYRRTRTTSPYMLTGLLFCAQCGNRYVGKYKKSYYINKNGERKASGPRYYGCAARLKRDKYYHPAKCKNTNFRADDLDMKVLDLVKKIRFASVQNAEVENKVFDTLVTEIKLTQEKIDKLLDLYMSDLITKPVYEQRVREYEKEIDTNKEILDKEKDKVDTSPLISVEYLAKEHARIDKMTTDEKRRFLTLIIKRIIIEGVNIHIEWRIKTL